MINKYINAKFPENFNFKKYEGKTIMVVGGGPTTNDASWENLEYDYIFSCNQYYECDKLHNKEIELVSLINRILVGNDLKLHEKLDNENTIIGIEPIHSSHVYRQKGFEHFYTKYSDRCIFFDTKFQSKSGVASRLAILAAMLKPKTIYMVGIDGHGDSTTLHSFDKNLVGIRDGNPLDVINKHHMQFSKYMYDICTELGISIYNLGEGHKDNAGTNVSCVYYPLTTEIKEKL
jgi:hypothetical protein